jgi:two-component system alkaline phosphatase synthesis response regulator PhoP
VPVAASVEKTQSATGNNSIMDASPFGLSHFDWVDRFGKVERQVAKCVLVVDDKQSLRRLVKSYLEQEGFRVVEASDGREALFVARHEKPDLIILDLMMPEMDGYEFMRLHRKEADTPVIMLTAKLEENDRVLGLEIGADDYVTKPFSMRELVARVRAVLRRTDKNAVESEVLRAADIVVDRSGHLVVVGDVYVDLTPSEFDLLVALMSAPGRAFSRFELLERLRRGLAFEGVERTIDVHIRNLRAKIEPDPGNPRYIETVYGVGYRFAMD